MVLLGWSDVDGRRSGHPEFALVLLVDWDVDAACINCSLPVRLIAVDGIAGDVEGFHRREGRCCSAVVDAHFAHDPSADGEGSRPVDEFELCHITARDFERGLFECGVRIFGRPAVVLH